MVPSGYEFYYVQRNNDKTGGFVGIIFKTGLSITTLSSSSTDTDTSNFDYIDCRAEQQGATIRFIVVYRPPTSTQNGLKNKRFFRKWTSFVEHMATDHTDSITVGDVNFHLDSDSNTDTRRFKYSLSICGLRQHVNEKPTNRATQLTL